MLDTILKGVQECGFDRVRLYLISEDERSMVGHAQVGMERNFVGFKMPIEKIHTQRLLADNRPHLFSSAMEQPVPFVEILEKEDVTEWADIPLIVDEKIIGQISVDNKFSKRKIMWSQVEPVALFASQAAVAIEQARLRVKERDAVQLSQKQARQLKELHMVSKHISSALNLEGVLQATLEGGLRAIGTDKGSIMLINPNTNELEIKAWIVEGRFKTEQRYRQLTMDEGIAGHVFSTGKSHNCPNLLYDPYFVDSLIGKRPCSLLCTPIISHDRVIGVINADHPSPDFFDDDDVQFLMTLAEQVAIALESQSLRDIGIMLSTLPLDKMLKKIVETAANLIGVETSAIYLASENPGEPMRAVKFPFDRAGDLQVRKNGTTNRVVKTGKPVIINDVQRHPLPKESTKGRGVQSMMAVPLKVRGRDNKIRNIGALSVDSLQMKAFSDRDQELLESLAGQAAVAIAVANEQDRSRRMADQLLALHAITTKMQSELELPRLLDLISQLAVELLDGDSGGILLLDETKQFLSFKGSYGLSSEMLTGTRDKIGTSIAGRVVKTKEAIISQNTPKDSRFYNPAAKKDGLLSIVSTPLWVDGEVIGTLDVHSKSDPYAFNKDKLQILTLMAAKAAIAIQNAMLFDQIRKARNAARVVAEVTALENLDNTLNSVVEGIIEVVGCDAATLFVYIEEEDRLVHPPTMAGVKYPERAAMHPEGLKNSVVNKMLMRKQPYVVENIKDDPLFKNRRFTIDENIISYITIPLQINVEKVGLMFVNYRQPHRFSKDELTNIELFANQAAVAIRNARLFEQIKKARNIAATVSKFTMLEELDNTLNLVVTGTIDVVGCDAATLFVYIPDERRLDHPPKMAGVRYPDRVSRYPNWREDSIVYKILEYDQPYIVENIATEPLFIDARFAKDEEIKSCIAIPLQMNFEKVGVMFVNYRKLHRFTQDELMNIELFANQATVAIRNSQQYRELEKTKGTLAARTAVDWLAAERAAWQHKIVGHISAIENYVKLLNKDLVAEAPQEKLQERLVNVERVIAKTREKKIAQPLGPDEGLESINLDEFIAQWLDRFYIDLELYSEISIQSLLNSDGVYIRVNPEWFKLALNNIMNNAIRALSDSSVKEVRVKTSIADRRIRIVISDTGTGIPPDVQSRLFVELIKKERGRRGEGIGLMLSKTIFETYGGDVKVCSTGPMGTSIVIWIPTEDI